MSGARPYEQEPEMTWPQVCEAVALALTLPAEHSDPWRQDRINPGEDAAALLLALVALCWTHTGMMPQRITTSAEPSFVAYYLRDGKHGGMEAYPHRHGDDPYDPPGVLFWTGLADFAEPLPICGAVQGDRFKVMAAFVGPTPT